MKPMRESAGWTVILDRETDGRFIASVPGVPDCHVYGRTASEAVRKVRAALRFYLTELGRAKS
ncbi:MAG: type II toxin-antitoxin system HicB family antitoxin [Planctomycetes bacterium]|nr:type II toxin-antitoxin system HicB family antitoxin [Planctomycetota bacterium]